MRICLLKDALSCLNGEGVQTLMAQPIRPTYTALPLTGWGLFISWSGYAH
jgi:hypothetical protein